MEQKKQGSVKTELGENKMKISKEGIALIKKFEGCELGSQKGSSVVSKWRFIGGANFGKFEKIY